MELVIRNATVVDGRASSPADVAISGGKFADMQPAGTAQWDAAKIVDGAGKFLVPGLWESHTHLRPILKDSEQASQAALDAVLREYRSRGITTVVDLGGPLDPYSAHRERQHAEGPAGRAQLLFAGPSFTGVNGWPMPLHHNPTCAYEVDGPAMATTKLRPLLDKQPDVIKIIYDGEPGSAEKLSLAALRAIVAEARDRGVRVMVHIVTQQDAVEALEAGADAIEHSFQSTPGREEVEAQELTDLFLRTGAYLTPTLAVWEQVGRAGDASYAEELAADGFLSTVEAEALLDPDRGWGQTPFPHHPKLACLERLAAARRMIRAMQSAGIKWAVGSDIATAMSRPAATLREMVLLAGAGVPARDVLLAATLHAAEKVGRGASMGSIERGKVADAVLLDANPLDDIGVLVRPGHLLATIKAGELSA